jgi:acyl carrier protein
MNQQIHDRVIQIIAKNQKIPLENIRLNQTIAEICDDSLDLVSLVFALEDEFNLDVTDKAKEAETVQDIIIGIETLLNAQQLEAIGEA